MLGKQAPFGRMLMKLGVSFSKNRFRFNRDHQKAQKPKLWSVWGVRGQFFEIVVYFGRIFVRICVTKSLGIPYKHLYNNIQKHINSL